VTVPVSGNASLNYKIYRSSDGLQLANVPLSSFTAAANLSNPLFGLLSGGEGGLYIREGVTIARPLPVRIHRWVEWRVTP
jgi:hypothetical protein